MPDIGTREQAALYRSAGLALCRPDAGTKKPTHEAWPMFSLEPWDFAEGDLIGILGGPLSDWNLPGHALVILDLDDPEALASADEHLPATGMVEGRPGKERDHRYYLVPVASIPPWALSTAGQAAAAAVGWKGHPGPWLKHFSRQGGRRVIDFIGTGGQVVCPGGPGPRRWAGGQLGAPAVVEFEELWSAVTGLAAACGCAPLAAASTPTTPASGNGRHLRSLTPDVLTHVLAYLASCDPAVSGQGGHDTTYWPARVVCYGFDLGEDVGFRILWEHYNPRCVPPWSERELRHKCHDADTLPFGRRRGWLLEAGADPVTGATLRLSGPNGQAEPAALTRVPASQLRRLPDAQKWLWDGLVPAEMATILSALPKAGKTTLLAHLLRSVGPGGTFCGRATRAARVVYVTEESETLWAERRDRLGLADHCEFVLRPFRVKPTAVHWSGFLKALTESLAQRPAELVVFDTLAKLWPVENENDASEVTAALMPLLEISYSTHATLLLVHHLRKSDGLEATATRGSGGLTAAVDSIVELRRFTPGDRRDRRRVLSCDGRYDDCLGELVVELSEDGTAYEAQGNRRDSTHQRLRGLIAALLPPVPPGRTADEILDQWSDDQEAPSERALRDTLRKGSEEGWWQREGVPRKGQSYTFWAVP